MRPVVIPLLAFPLGLLSMLLGLNGATPLQPMALPGLALQPQWQSRWMPGLAQPDPALDQIMANYIAGLEQRGRKGAAQGVWLQAGNQVLAEHQGTQLLSAASLTKLATTLAMLKTWPPEHQFETRVGLNGSVQDGVLQGDLIVQGGGDPLFVWEEAIALANSLQQLGLRQVTGDLVVMGRFTMNFEADPEASLTPLYQAMNAAQWPAEAHQAYGQMPLQTPQPSLQIDGTARLARAGDADSVRWIMRHQSLPLIAVLKAMNIYSNNVMADGMADLVGGPGAVTTLATQAADLPPGEISLVNGSGLGTDNQMTPRAVVALLNALQQTLEPQKYSISDLLPVAGEDVGTLIDRRIPDTSAVKTGSLDEVSALAGVLPTANQGPVWFAILNQGWDISDLRVQQDLLLQAVQAHWGTATVPPALASHVRLGQAPYLLGDPQRNQALDAKLE